MFYNILYYLFYTIKRLFIMLGKVDVWEGLVVVLIKLAGSRQLECFHDAFREEENLKNTPLAIPCDPIFNGLITFCFQAKWTQMRRETFRKSGCKNVDA